MKEALEILKQLNGVGAWERWCLSLPSNTKINEAISELEAQENNSCKQCEHFSEGIQKDSFNWKKCGWDWECKRYFEDRFEPKETK